MTPTIHQPHHSAVAFVLLFLVPNTFANGQKPREDDVEIRFELRSESIVKDASVFITGSVAGLGFWNPSKVKMKPSEPGLWVYTIKAKQGSKIEYKYTLGNWANEGAKPDGSPLPNFKLTASANTTVKDKVEKWTDPAKRPLLDGQVTGQLRYHRKMKFEGLLPRDIVVWLPENYEKVNTRYGVLYMHDGQNLFDPSTSSFGVDWQIDETLANLQGQQKYTPMICVGICNTPQRNRDYLPGKQNNTYLEFIVKKLKPFIDTNYRTRPQRKYTSVGGSSNGGICAFRCAWNYPDVFSRAFCFSPAFRYRNDHGKLVINYIEEFSNSPNPIHAPFLIIANGGLGLDKHLQEGVDAMEQSLAEKGLNRPKDFVIKIYPNSQHNEAAWAKQFSELAKDFLGSNSPGS